MNHRTVTLDEVRRQARELGLIDTDDESDSDPSPSPATMDTYQTYAAQFRERTQITDADAQFKCLVEEVGELAEALNCERDPSGEIADVLITAFVLADVLEIDVREAYTEKMAHNLRKSPSKQGGKVVDDA